MYSSSHQPPRQFSQPFELSGSIWKKVGARGDSAQGALAPVTTRDRLAVNDQDWRRLGGLLLLKRHQCQGTFGLPSADRIQVRSVSLDSSGRRGRTTGAASDGLV